MDIGSDSVPLPISRQEGQSIQRPTPSHNFHGGELQCKHICNVTKFSRWHEESLLVGACLYVAMADFCGQPMQVPARRARRRRKVPFYPLLYRYDDLTILSRYLSSHI